MLTESQRRAAALAVARYGADRVRVRETAVAFRRAQDAGHAGDLLTALVRENLLSPAQAQELRDALEQTQINVAGPRPTPAPTEAAAPAADPRRLGGFRILRRLGEGGMGAVYLAYEEKQRRQVALKVLPDALAANESYVERFDREARSAAQLDHPNIVRFVAVGQDPEAGKHYLALEYVDGPSAHALLDRFGRLAVGDAVHIVLDIARGLEHAQSRNIVHRDIKPDNILLTRSGVAKLADLGLAKRTDEDSHLTGARQGFGTPFYMPYEQAINARQADGRSDIFALGATLYHLVTGEVPFPGNSALEVAEKKSLGTFPPARALNANVPEALERILNKMLARSPDDRYQTASELLVDLERAALAAPVPSFVDPDLALQDPLVRARLTAPQPTQMDLSGANPAQRPVDPDVWYLRYRNPAGRWCKTRASTTEIRSRLRGGRLPRGSEASHLPQGGFRPLRDYPEFREFVPRVRKQRPAGGNGAAPAHCEPAAVPSPAPRLRRQVLWLVPLAVVLLSGVVVLAYFYFVG